VLSGSRSKSTEWHPIDDRLEHRDKMHTLPDRSNSVLTGSMRPVLRDKSHRGYNEYQGLHSHSTEVPIDITPTVFKKDGAMNF